MNRAWPIVAVGVLLIAPLVIVSAWLHENDRWAPVHDLAMTEVRVRDVGTVHTPLVGLPGRLGRPERASHPGPLSFYLLSPVYRMLGGSYWALRVSTATFNAVAMISALLIARRRAGTPAVIATGLGIVFLELGFGLLVLTEPWNPHLPIFWFVTFLLALWCISSGDVWMLPVALGIGCLCAQTHIPYAAICGGLGSVAFVSVAVSAVTMRRRGQSAREPVRACLTALAVVLVLWAPPVIEECTHRLGNMTIIARYFLHPPEASVGLAAAARVVLEHLDAWQLAVGAFLQPHDFAAAMPFRVGVPTRGAVVLALWVVTAAVSLKLRILLLCRLHAVVATSLVVVWLSTSRIIGAPWNYLLFNQWAVGALLVGATAWTAAVLLVRKMPDRLRARAKWVQAFGVAIIGACALRLSTQTKESGSTAPGPSLQLAEIAPRTAAAILRGTGGATGRRGRYLVTWRDAVNPVAEGFGLVNELERRGLRVGVTEEFGRLMTEHRVLDPGTATLRVHLATGGWISHAMHEPGAIRVAYSDPRTRAMREEFHGLRQAMIFELDRLDRRDTSARLDLDISAADVPGLNPFLRLAMARMIELGMPAAAFVAPAR